MPDQELNPSPLRWECRILATGPAGKSQGPVLGLQPASLNSQIPCKSCVPNMSVQVPQGADPAGIRQLQRWPRPRPRRSLRACGPVELSVIMKICVHSVHSHDPWPHAAVEPLGRGQCDRESGFVVCFLLIEASGAAPG